jgi:hypothetical protein
VSYDVSNDNRFLRECVPPPIDPRRLQRRPCKPRTPRGATEQSSTSLRQKVSGYNKIPEKESRLCGYAIISILQIVVVRTGPSSILPLLADNLAHISAPCISSKFSCRRPEALAMDRSVQAEGRSALRSTNI